MRVQGQAGTSWSWVKYRKQGLSKMHHDMGHHGIRSAVGTRRMRAHHSNILLHYCHRERKQRLFVQGVICVIYCSRGWNIELRDSRDGDNDQLGMNHSPMKSTSIATGSINSNKHVMYHEKSSKQRLNS